MSRSAPARRGAPIRASGGVVWRDGPDGREVLAVHRPRYDDWSLPKGKREDSERAPTTAVREIEEETGWRVRLGPELRTARYEVDGVPKEVRYWLAEPLTRAAFRPDREVDEVAWLTLPVARARLRPNDYALAHAGLKRGRPSRPFVIVRHGLSVPRKEWSDDDRDRPLNRKGAEQSERLVPLLAAWAPSRIVSSSSRRCRDTVAPFAERTGISLELSDLLSEEAFEADPKASRRFVKDLRDSRDALVLCTHRPLLPMIADLIALDLPRQARSNPLPKAGCWVAHAGPKDPVERHTV